MKVRIIGAGAVGAVVGYKLSHVADTAFIVDEERKKRYSEGFIINGEHVSFSLKTRQEADKADLLVFAVKNMQLEEAMEEGRKVPFMDSQRIVDIEAVREILDEIRKALPEELKQATAIVKDRSTIMAQANKKAEMIIQKLG